MAAIRPMTTAELTRIVPSAFADSPNNVSDRYSYVGTKPIMERVMDYGFIPVGARSTRSADYRHGLHSIDFATREGIDKCRDVGAHFPMLTVTNSHNAECSIMFSATLFTVICSNTARTTDSRSTIKLRHVGLTTDVVIGCIEKSINSLTVAHEEYVDWSNVLVDRVMQAQIAKNAAEAAELEVAVPFDLVRPRFSLEQSRTASGDRNLKQVFDSLQGRLRNGGVRLMSGKKTRPITSIKGQDRYDDIAFSLIREAYAASV